MDCTIIEFRVLRLSEALSKVQMGAGDTWIDLANFVGPLADFRAEEYAGFKRKQHTPLWKLDKTE